MILLRYWRIIAGVLLIVGLVAFVYSKGHKAGYAKGQAELEAYRLEVGTRILEANARADRAAKDFEEWKRTHRPRVVTVVKEVDRALDQNRAWADERIPDSVRDALAAAAAIDAAGEPAGAVPAVPVRAPANECGPGASVPGCHPVGSGVPGQASPAQ